ncbi:hypothetical protein AAGV28_03045 [Flavobacterium sp. FZUC8N2.13]|uniref:RiboL-PSP-HEPN domain-containing protein n=1 Tax=Flavobacterium zubiriense TaxID=3138075 RepID=A0ABV4TBF8_9FLAO
MKHIKRKFLKEHKFTQDGYDFTIEQGKVAKKIKGNLNDFVPYIITTDQKFIQGFFYNLDGKKVMIGEPNPIVIYFSNAQGFLSSILEYRNDLFEGLKNDKTDVDVILNAMFGFYSVVTSFSSSLFNSLEAMINSKIPKDFTMANSRRRNSTMNKYEVIRHTGFEDKIKIVLKHITGNNFAEKKNSDYNELIKLKTLRDNITHAKANIDYEVNYYEKLYTEALDFNYEKSLDSAKEFINFYEDNLIEPCDCGLTH